MVLPTPSPKQSRDEFVASCMSNETVRKEFSDQKQRLGICFSQFTKGKKESRFSTVRGFETKEGSEGELIKGGYIATTHLDSGFYDETRDLFIRDQLDKVTLDVWADQINDGNPRVNKVSVNHNREPHVAGVGVKGTARVDELGDGEYGLYVDTLVDKTKDNYEETSYRIDNNLLDSFSIEFNTHNLISHEYLENSVVEEEVDKGIIRTLLPGTELEGWTLASQPMNEHAVMIKEIKNKISESIKHNKKEEKIMVETKLQDKPISSGKTAATEAPKKEIQTVKTDDEPKGKEKEISKDDLALLKEFKEVRAKEAKEKERKVIIDKIKEDLKESLNEIKVETKTRMNKDVNESIEMKEYKERLFEKKDEYSKEAMIAVAGKLADNLGLTSAGMLKMDSKSAEAREYKNFAVNGAKLEYKGLGLTTNQNTDTDYLLSAAELSDVFDPMIFNILNQKTTTWNLLNKEDFSTKGNNQVQFTLKIAANTTAAAFTGNAVILGNVTRLKFQTKFKKYQVGVEIDGDMIAAARGGPVGDVFAKEVSDSTEDLMAVINADLFAEVGLETAAAVIGFEYITDQAGNTTLYNLTRTQANGLSSTTTGDNFINGNSNDITLANLRAAKRKAVGVEGADLNNMVFITSFIQGDKFRGIFDASQRTVPTSSRFGFEGRPEFDGIPVWEDKDCNDDDWFLVDLETHRIAIWVPPTLEMLGKDSDSQKGFIKTYFATFNRAPRRMIQIFDNATS